MAVKSSQVSPKLLVLGAFLLGVIYLINEAAGGLSWFVTLSFDMDRENTIQSWFSSFLWILCALTAWEVAGNQKAAFEKGVWRVIAAVLLFFSADESSMIHENLAFTVNRFLHVDAHNHLLWPVVLAPFLLLFMAGAGWVTWRLLDLRKPAHQKMLLGLLVFLTGAVGFETIWDWRSFQEFKSLKVFAEEFCEMLGAILIYSGLLTDKNTPEELPAVYFKNELLQEALR